MRDRMLLLIWGCLLIYFQCSDIYIYIYMENLCRALVFTIRWTPHAKTPSGAQLIKWTIKQGPPVIVTDHKFGTHPNGLDRWLGLHSFWTVKACRPLIKWLGWWFKPPSPYIGRWGWDLSIHTKPPLPHPRVAGPTRKWCTPYGRGAPHTHTYKLQDVM